MDSNDAGNVQTIYVFHSWDPDSFDTIMDKWIDAGEKVLQLGTKVGGIATVFAAAV
jgi:hypothetical protein